MKNYYKTVGDRVRMIRKSKSPKMSSEKLAELSGLNYVTINNLENGKMPDVKLGTILKVAKALGVQPEVLVANEQVSGAIDRLKQIQKLLLEVQEVEEEEQKTKKKVRKKA